MKKSTENTFASNPTCPLCSSKSEDFYKSEFFLCNECMGIFRTKVDYPEFENEKRRYELHNNDIENEGYLVFLSPIIDKVSNEQSKSNRGLDFGAGPNPVVTTLLKGSGFNVRSYDPFFANRKELLEEVYDYIICSEVIEHFHNPKESFKLLKRLLKPKGRLYIMTLIFDGSINFASWHYKNDFTHTFIYQKETFDWIKDKYGFETLGIDGRLIELG